MSAVDVILWAIAIALALVAAWVAGALMTASLDWYSDLAWRYGEWRRRRRER